jgi:hypothetical protein
MHLGRHLRILQCKKINGGVFNVHWIVLGLHDKRWRSVAGGMNVRVRRKILLCERKVAGIDDYCEIRPATGAIRRVNPIVKSLFEVGAERRGQVRPSGKS